MQVLQLLIFCDARTYNNWPTYFYQSYNMQIQIDSMVYSKLAIEAKLLYILKYWSYRFVYFV